MPLYEYQCDACGHRFEVIQKYSDPLIDTCPKCGSTVHKLISSPAIQFKGTGFYITDYPKNESGGAPKSSGGKDKESSASSESSSDKGGDKAGTGSDKGSEKNSEKSAEKAKGSEPASSDRGAGRRSENSGKSDSAAAPAPAPASTPAPSKKD
jgi:putative FmdB family regulatory protein